MLRIEFKKKNEKVVEIKVVNTNGTSEKFKKD
jgi:hypothetical protein